MCYDVSSTIVQEKVPPCGRSSQAVLVKPGVSQACRGSVSSPLLSTVVFDRRTRPFGVASFGRVTPAPADSNLYRRYCEVNFTYEQVGLGFGGLGVSAIVLQEAELFKEGRSGGRRRRWDVASVVFTVFFLDRVLQRHVEQIIEATRRPSRFSPRSGSTETSVSLSRSSNHPASRL